MITNSNTLEGLSSTQVGLKRGFDLCLSLIALIISCWIILLAWVIATLETRSNGFFCQLRVGRHGKLFKVIKIKTMYASREIGSTVTYSGDVRITRFGRFFRILKIDELPQLLNVLVGDMSFVGPRPDVPGFADQLIGSQRILLSVRPGITGPASIKYRNEESLLARQSDPEIYNMNVIWPDKVKINVDYVINWKFSNDISYILRTFFNT